MSSPPRRIWLCADDYGISRTVDGAIRDLVVQGRLNATSVMVAAPSCDRAEAVALAILNASVKRVAIGLHVTLTAPFRPLSKDFRPLAHGAFLPLDKTLLRACLRSFRREQLASEIASQVKVFVEKFGRTPDFIDGHQHVHIFPQIRDAFLGVVKEAAPRAWVRQCGRAVTFSWRLGGDRKALLLDLFSRGFRRRAAALGVRTNPAFAGTYDFAPDADIAEVFPRFLDQLPDGGLIMCHPGMVDAELERVDPLTTLREREYAYFSGDAFPAMLARKGFTLGGLAAMA
jgi:predicted glycoside hydrolase/deacetylase ChbG (UPF0249 family)